MNENLPGRLTVLVALAGLVCISHLASAADSRCQHFITRRGDKLYDGEKEFRFIGANMPGLVLPYDWTLYLPERMHLPTPWEQEDAFKTLDQMNLRVVRTWNLPIRGPHEEPKSWHYVLGPGQFNEEAFQTVDHLFALANQYGVRVIFDLTAESGDYLGGIGTYAAHRGKKRAEFYTDPQLKEDYKATVRYVLTRTNRSQASATATTRPSSPGNSATKCTVRRRRGWRRWRRSSRAWTLTISLPRRGTSPVTRWSWTRISISTRGTSIPTTRVLGSGWPDTCRKEMAAVKGQRPFFIGEFGPYIDGKVLTQDNVVPNLREFLDFCCAEPGISGAMIWSMYFHHQDGGFYWHQIMTYPAVWSYHWPGFPSAEAQREQGILTAMREAAFKIQGLPVPPVPAPDAPELLPIGDVPLLTWRGSAGASGYDIERASHAEGPWLTIAADVSDADTAYRPLFSDTTARTGQTCFYRVCARNTSGRSGPSNVVGPVTVKRLCLADELQDFSRVAAKSDGLTLNNAYNALYAEYLFRAQGGTNDWLTYQVPGTIESVKVVAFCPSGKIADLQFQAGDTTLQPQRTERPLASPPGGAAGGQRRTWLQYDCAVPPGHSQLKILWTGPAELDRVEIEHIR